MTKGYLEEIIGLILSLYVQQAAKLLIYTVTGEQKENWVTPL